MKIEIKPDRRFRDSGHTSDLGLKIVLLLEATTKESKEKLASLWRELEEDDSLGKFVEIIKQMEQEKRRRQD